MPQSRAYSFGPFTLVRETRTLLEGTREISLGDRAIDLLFALVEQGTQVVSKQALLRRAWPDAQVDESTLRFHIASLRRALGDDASANANPNGGHRYILNISGRGYCFVAPMERLPGPGAPRAPAAGLPARTGRLIGRERVLEDLCALLAERRCVSVVGAGGMGKSSLAFALADRQAHRYSDGIFVLDVALIADGPLVASTLAHQIGTVHAPETAVEAVCAWFRLRRCLLIMDSCETQIDACAALAQALLQHAAELHILTTSREALRVKGEWVLQLKPLALPPPPWTALSRPEALSFPSVRLALERARATRADFTLDDADIPHLCELVTRLDGMPLAIELAAVRLAALPMADLLRELQTRFLFSSQGRRSGLDRHRTLGALLDWSYERLSAPEQAVLRRLSVCNGAFTLDTALAISATPDLSEADITEAVMGLEAKSLLAVEEDHRPVRLRLLDSTRAYAADKLGRGDDYRATRVRHNGFLRQVMLEAAQRYPSLSLEAWLRHYGPFNNDMRENIAWAFGADGDIPRGIALVAVSMPYAHQMTLAEEYLVHVLRALVLLPDSGLDDPTIEHQLLLGQCILHQMSLGPGAEIIAVYERALALAARTDAPRQRAEAFNGLFNNAFFGMGDYAEAERIAARLTALAEATPALDITPLVQRVTLLAAHGLGRHAQAREALEALIRAPLSRQGLRPPFPTHIAVMGRMALVRILWLQGLADDAEALSQELLQLATQDQRIASTNAYAWAVCPLHLWSGDEERARAAIQRMYHSALQINTPYVAAWACAYDRAWALQHHQPLQLPVAGADVGHALAGGVVSELVGTMHPAMASPALLARARQGSTGWSTPELLRVDGELAMARGEFDLAVERFDQALRMAREHGALAWELRVATSIAALALRRAEGLAHAQAEGLARGQLEAAAQQLAAVLQHLTQGLGSADARRARDVLAQCSSR